MFAGRFLSVLSVLCVSFSFIPTFEEGVITSGLEMIKQRLEETRQPSHTLQLVNARV